MLRRACAALALLVLAAPASAQSPDPRMPRPIEALDTIWIEEMTWLEVRDAMKAGKTTVIVPSGGIEQNGPYLATGKHNYVNRATCEAIARKLGTALCAPNVPFVPEGAFDPPSGHMRYPGTISVTEATFQALLTDVATSLKTHGFEHIVFIGDSGGNQAGMKAVAETLAPKWAASSTRIHFVPEYYQYEELLAFAAATFGWTEVPEGHHDDPAISSIIMTVDPDAVRIRQRMAKGNASINGIPLTPLDQAVARGRTLIEHRAQLTVDAIRKALAR